MIGGSGVNLILIMNYVTCFSHEYMQFVYRMPGNVFLTAVLLKFLACVSVCVSEHVSISCCMFCCHLCKEQDVVAALLKLGTNPLRRDLPLTVIKCTHTQKHARNRAEPSNDSMRSDIVDLL